MTMPSCLSRICSRRQSVRPFFQPAASITNIHAASPAPHPASGMIARFRTVHLPAIRLQGSSSWGFLFREPIRSPRVSCHRVGGSTVIAHNETVPFIISTKGPNVKKPVAQYDILRFLREFLQWRQGDRSMTVGQRFLCRPLTFQLPWRHKWRRKRPFLISRLRAAPSYQAARKPPSRRHAVQSPRPWPPVSRYRSLSGARRPSKQRISQADNASLALSSTLAKRPIPPPSR